MHSVNTCAWVCAFVIMLLDICIIIPIPECSLGVILQVDAEFRALKTFNGMYDAVLESGCHLFQPGGWVLKDAMDGQADWDGVVCSSMLIFAFGGNDFGGAGVFRLRSLVNITVGSHADAGQRCDGLDLLR